MKKLILTSILLAALCGCATISLPPLPCREIARTQARWAKENGYDARIQLFKRAHIVGTTKTRMGYTYHAACYITHDGKAYWGSEKYPYTGFKRGKCPYGTPITEAQFREMVGLQSGVDR